MGGWQRLWQVAAALGVAVATDAFVTDPDLAARWHLAAAAMLREALPSPALAPPAALPWDPGPALAPLGAWLGACHWLAERTETDFLTVMRRATATETPTGYVVSATVPRGPMYSHG